MITRKYKTLNGWVAAYQQKYRWSPNTELYVPISEFFAEKQSVYYYSNFGTEDEKWHNYYITTPWDNKLDIAHEIALRTWSNRPTREKEQITMALAQGRGDLTMLRSFYVALKKRKGRWYVDYVTNGLPGSSYDYRKIQYLISIGL